MSINSGRSRQSLADESPIVNEAATFVLFNVLSPNSEFLRRLYFFKGPIKLKAKPAIKTHISKSLVTPSCAVILQKQVG